MKRRKAPTRLEIPLDPVSGIPVVPVDLAVEVDSAIPVVPENAMDLADPGIPEVLEVPKVPEVQAVPDSPIRVPSQNDPNIPKESKTVLTKDPIENETVQVPSKTIEVMRNRYENNNVIPKRDTKLTKSPKVVLSRMQALDFDENNETKSAGEVTESIENPKVVHDSEPNNSKEDVNNPMIVPNDEFCDVDFDVIFQSFKLKDPKFINQKKTKTKRRKKNSPLQPKETQSSIRIEPMIDAVLLKEAKDILGDNFKTVHSLKKCAL